MEVKCFTFNMFGVNTYIIWDKDNRDAFVIDPGMISNEDKRVFDTYIQDNNLNVCCIINTHQHLDHTFGDLYVKEKYSCPIKAHIGDHYLGQHLTGQARMFGIYEEFEPINIDEELKEGDILPLGNENIQVIHVPGHSPGSILLYAPNSKILISGDVLFKQSIGRTDLTGGNYDQLITGINSKLMNLPHDTIVYPGHGPQTTIGYEITYNPFL